MKNRLIGISLIMVAVWGGSYAVHYFGAFSWTMFPITITAIFVAAFGIAIGTNEEGR